MLVARANSPAVCPYRLGAAYDLSQVSALLALGALTLCFKWNESSRFLGDFNF